MSNKQFSIKGVWPLIKSAFKGFSEDKVPKLSASLAYYTVFALGPLLVIIITVCAFILGPDAINNGIYNQMKGFVGASAADQMQEIVKNASLSGKGTGAAILGGIMLLIGATSIFGEIQDSINQIWGIKPKPKVGMMKLVKDRLLSFGILGTLGFLLLVSLGATAIVESIGDRLKDRFPDVTVVVFYIISLVLNLTITTLLFAVIFKVLPDAKITWKEVWPGAIATSILFLIGKFAISLYISKADVGGTYGTAGSLVIILVWIYYSSMILYLGAEFTKSYVVEFGSGIKPNHYAEVVEDKSVPKEERDAAKAPAQPQPPKQDAVPAYHVKRGPSKDDAGERPRPAPRPQPAAPGLAYTKEAAPITGTHLTGVPAVAVGLVAFLVNFVRSNGSQGY